MTAVMKERQAILLERRRSRRSTYFSGLSARVGASPESVRELLAHADSDTVWISFDQERTNSLLKSIDWRSRSVLGVMMLMYRPDLETLPTLRERFREVIFSTSDGFLPLDELGEVLAAENRRDLFLGGTLDRASETLTLWRGDFSSLTVPLGAFSPSGDGTAPDFSAFSVSDYGHTIKFGAYEAAADAILYEFDADFRRRKTKERHAAERSLGASIRRLRAQKKLRREDFAPLNAKTIARIEQGKVEKVHSKTLATIARKLGVQPGEIEEY